jgi:ATP-dependent Lon protease
MKEETKIVSIGQFELKRDTEPREPDLTDLPVIPMRDLVLFPGVTFPITMGRESTVATATAAAEKGIPVGIFCQTDPADETPTASSLHKYGVIADVVKTLELPDGTKTAIISARGKVAITGEGAGKTIPGSLSVAVREVREAMPRPTDKEFAVMVTEIRDITLNILRQEQDKLSDLVFNIENVSTPVMLVNLIATHSAFSVKDKIEMLKKPRIKDRAMYLLSLLAQNEQMAELKAEIQRKTRRNMDEQQRNMLLHQQFETLRDELFGDEDDCAMFQAKAAGIAFPEEVRKRFDKEVEKLRRLNPQSPDYSVQYSYLQVLTDLPWGKEASLNDDFVKAEEILNSDHYGLEKVKERILEQLAVMMNNPGGRSPILCLVGAPGVGKTSLGQSIARSLGRPYQRVSLGGLHDEAEIRGHRRTYIGAMPGRIIDAIRRAGSSNPVLLLDEIDKTGSDYKGDPSSALLEVLDPEQNSHFHDNYVDVDYDLSHVLFIATANTLSTIPQPLLDRMEIIDISGYLLEEKVEIARRHLVPRVAAENGFAPDYFDFTPEAIVRIVEGYTSESGVRQLEKRIAKVVRQIILRKMRGKEFSAVVTPDVLREYLGVERYTPERYEATDIPGVAVGLAWTSVGGEILFIESAFTQGKGEKLTLTGNLGDVMKESAVIASQVVRARASRYGVEPEWFDTRQLHIHVPEGAIPKDGPSAGITMCTSILSALTGIPVKPRLAMTGEITLRGKVLPVGGIKEKILAAKRAGITDIILCADNRKDIEDIRPIYLEGVAFHYVKTIDDVFEIALEK